MSRVKLDNEALASQALSSDSTRVTIDPIRRSDLSIEIEAVTLAELAITRGHTSSGFDVTKEGPQYGYSFSVINEGHVTVREPATSVSPLSRGIVIGPATEWVSNSPGTRWHALHVSTGPLVRAFERFSHRSWNSPPQFKIAMDTRLIALFMHLHRAVYDGVSSGVLKDNPLAAECFQDALLRMAYASLNGMPTERMSVSRRQVARAMDFMVANAHRPITITDVAHEVGMGLRSLQLAFAEHLEQSPYAFLRMERLNGARRDLSSGRITSVLEVARKWGFTSSSSFSRAYLEQFGESPSQTLR